MYGNSLFPYTDDIGYMGRRLLIRVKGTSSSPYQDDIGKARLNKVEKESR